MSNASRKRFESKNEYFDYLKETAIKVDPYVRKSISNKYSNSDLEKMLISRYRFGKSQLRPAQVRLAYELFGGIDWEKTIPACASVEVKDTGYYCLDDFFDKKQNNELVLLQGIFSSLSYSMVSDLFNSFSSNQIKQVLDELSDLDSKNAKAASIDTRLTHSCEESYFAKVEGYNFWETPLRIGAILADASKKDIDLIGNIGKYIGMGYIIANDTWDFGKDLEDFRTGKYTLPIIHLFNHAKLDEVTILSDLFGKKELSDGEKNFIKGVYVHNGSLHYGKQLAQEYCNIGLRLLESLQHTKFTQLLEFATTMIQRNRFYDNLKKYD